MSRKIRNQPWTEKDFRKRIIAAILTYDSDVAYIKDPTNNMSPSNVGFERHVLIDHIEMIIDHYLETHGIEREPFFKMIYK